MDKFVYLFENIIVSCHAWTAPTITGSCFTRGCIEKGKVLQRRGADHRYSTIAITGVANIADSLAAIEKCVFEKKYLTMDELMVMIATDFEGNKISQFLMNKAPKYGNDIEEAKHAHWLSALCNDRYASIRTDAAEIIRWSLQPSLIMSS